MRVQFNSLKPPSSGQTFTLSRGGRQETWTFVRQRRGRFFVSIGRTPEDNCQNLVQAIRMDSQLGLIIRPGHKFFDIIEPDAVEQAEPEEGR